MECGELMRLAEANLKVKGIMENYRMVDNCEREGAETNFVGRLNLRYFQRYGFKFRMIDSVEASTETILFNRKFETPILSAALSGLTDIIEKPLREIALGVGKSGSMMWVGIVVSNHGGAIIDYAAHPLEVFPEIKEFVGNQMPIFVDSGFRLSSDVMKALALGADAVLMGWPLPLGLAANGSECVAEMIAILTAELRRIMSVTGCRNLAEIDDSILVKRDLFM